MKKSKKLLGIVLSLLMIISCFPVMPAFADSVVEIYNGDTQVTEKIELQEYRSVTLTAVISEETSAQYETTTVSWVSNLPLLADVDDEGKVTAYDYSKKAIIQLWIDENIASLPLVGDSMADAIWKAIEDNGIDVDDVNNDVLIAVIASVVGDDLAASLKTMLDNMNVEITATVYDTEGNVLGSDTVEVLVEKSTIANVAPTGVHITNKKVVPKTVAVGATVQLYGVCTPVRLEQGVKWTVGSSILDTDSSKCATVSSDGLVTFTAAGTCTVRVNPESSLYAAFSDTVTFTVLEQSAYPVKDFEITGDDSVGEGKTTQLAVKNITPDGAYWGDLTWKSSNTAVAVVDENGVVTGLDGGDGTTYSREVTITAQIGSVIKEWPMKVTRSIISSLSSVEISGSTAIGIGVSQQLVATVNPTRLNNNSGVVRTWGVKDPSSDEIIWATADTPATNGFVTVDVNGLLTGVSEGVSTVYVAATYGSSQVFDTLEVVSGNAITDFEIVGSTSVKEGEDTTLSINVKEPSNYTVGLLDTVVWSIDDSSVARVTGEGQKGVVHGRDAGSSGLSPKQTATVSATVCGVTKSTIVTVTRSRLSSDDFTDAYIIGDDTIVRDFPRQYKYETYPSRVDVGSYVWGMEDDEGNAPWDEPSTLSRPSYSKANHSNSVSNISEGGTLTATGIGSANLHLYISISGLNFNYTQVQKTVDFVEVEPTSITITPPTKTDYVEGDTELDLTGMEVYLTYSKDALKPYYSDAESFTEEQLKVQVDDFVVREMNTSLLDAEQYILVSVTRAGKTLNTIFPITIASKQVNSIEVTKAPDKYEYLEGGEELDLTGLEITANYDNAIPEFVNDYTIDDESYDLTLYNEEQQVRVVYEHAGRTAEAFFPIIVYGKPVLTVNTQGTVGEWTPDDVKFSFTSTNELEGATYKYKISEAVIPAEQAEDEENTETDTPETDTPETAEWIDIEGAELTVTGNTNTVYVFKAVNSHGIESDESTAYEVKIDTVEPSFELTPAVTDITNESYSVTIDDTVVGESDIKELTLNGESILGSEKFTVDENGTYTVVLTAGNGLYHTQSIEITNIDKEAPEITSVNISQTPADAPSRVLDAEKFGKFFSGNLVATVNAIDHGVAGIEKTEYRLTPENGEPGEWALYENGEQVLCSAQFKGVIEFRVTDFAGNTSEVFVSDGVVRDGEAPVISNVKATSGGEDYVNGSWVADVVRFTPEATAFSGIYEYYIKMDDGEWEKFTDPYVEVTEDGSHEYFFKAVSYSGLESEPYSFRVNIDRVMPLVRVDFEGTFGRWTCENVQFTLSTLNELPSGVTYYYDCGNGWQKIDGNIATFTENTNAYYMFKAVNGAGIESAPSDSYKVMIDTEEPTAEYVLGMPNKTSVPYDISFIPVCGDSGIRKIYFDGEDITETKTATVKKNGRYILTVVGNNLLSSTKVITITNFSNLPQDQFLYTTLPDETIKVLYFRSENEVVTVPYEFDNLPTAVIADGAFRDCKNVKEVAIQNGITTIGESCFEGCESLEKITIPETVTEIGAYAFSNCNENLTIYCYEDSYALQYAIDNSINYVILDIKPLGRTEVDEDNFVIYSDMTGCTKVSDFLSAPGYYIVGLPSQVSGTTEYYGTGSTIFMYKDGKLKYTYKFVLRGDVDGDGFVDVLDVVQTQRAANEQTELYDDYVLAADYDNSGGVEAIDYQCVLNAALWS